ncbi:MAG: hypothetical protein R3C11_20745 [Planctomycetaceae bacterium]
MQNNPEPKSTSSKVLQYFVGALVFVIGAYLGHLAVNKLFFSPQEPDPPVEAGEIRLETLDTPLIVESQLNPVKEAASLSEVKNSDKQQDNVLKEQLKGTWTQTKDVKQTLVLEEDGTGTLTVEVGALLATVFGEKVVMQINWSVDKGRAIFTSLSGEPEVAFNYIKEHYGTKRDRKIDSLDDDTLVLLDDLDDNSRSEWTRLEGMN